MPQVGNVWVPDEQMPTMALPAASRPGLGAVFNAGVEGAAGALRYGVPYAYKKLANELQPGDEAFYQEGLYNTNRAAAKAAPADISDVISGKVGLGRFAVENLVGAIPYMVSGAIGAVGGGVAAGPAGAAGGFVAGAMPQFVGTNVGRAVEENGGLSDAAAATSIGASIPQAASELLVGRFIPGVGKALGFPAPTDVGKGFLRRTAESMGKAGLTEAVTEAGQQMGERASAGIPLTTPDAAAEYVSAAAAAFVVGGTLGAGGGFRRHAAIAKPAGQVGPEDMLDYIEQGLSDNLRTIGPVERQQVAEEQLGLGLEGGQAQEVQPSLPMGQPEIPEALPSELPQLPLDPALSTVPPETQLELGQRFRDNITPMDLAPPGTAVTPETEAAIAAAARGPELSMAARLRLGERAVPFDGAPAVVEPTLSDTELLLQTRGGNSLADPFGDGRRLPEEPFAPVLAEAKKGVATNQWVKKLDAVDEFDLMNKVYDQIFTEQDTRAGTTKLAQRLGILNEDLTKGPVAEEVEARRAADQTGTSAADAGGNVQGAPPASTTAKQSKGSQAATERVAAESVPAVVQPAAITTAAPDPVDVAAVADAKKAIGVQRAGNLNQLSTPADVFNAMATDRSEAKRGGDATRVEQLAKRLGLITNDDAMDYTPKGRQVFLQSPQGADAVVSAAADNGYAGASAPQFESGVRAQLSGQEQTTFSGGFSEMEAYNAGKAWARNFVERGDVQTAAQTKATQARLDARATGTAVAREDVRSSVDAKRQGQYDLINNADLSDVPDADIVALRRMVADGVDAAALGQEIQRLQGGAAKFIQPPRQTGEKFTSIDEEADNVLRRRRRVREKIAAEKEAFDKAGNDLLNRGPSKASARAETEAAVRAFELRGLIDLARNSNAITKERATRLHNMLNDGKIKAVEKNMKSFLDSDIVARMEDRRGGRRTDDLVGMADGELQRAVEGKTFMDALDEMIERAPTAYHRQMMRGVKALADRMVRAGTQFDFRIVKPGDVVPGEMLANAAEQELGTRAYTRMWKVPARVEVVVKGIEMGPEAGMNYQVLAHEMVHGVTLMLTNFYQSRSIAANDKLGQAVRDLQELALAVQNHFRTRQAEGNLSALEAKFVNNNAFQDADEVLAWGLTNPDMQRYLATLEYTRSEAAEGNARQTVWGKLVELLRRVLSVGLGGTPIENNSALAELLRVSEQITGASQGDVSAVFMRNRADARPDGVLMAALQEGGASAANRTVAASTEQLKGFAKMAGAVMEKVAPDWKQSTRRGSLRWMSHNQLNRTYGARLPALLAHTEAHRWRDAVRANFDAMGDEAYQTFEKLERDNKKAAEWVGQLMATTTEFQVDPEKAWEDHKHIAEKDRARVKPMYDAAVKMKNDLSRGDGVGYQLFKDFRAYNEAQNYARLAANLHNLVALDPELKLGVHEALVNPVETFLSQRDKLISATQIRNWWHGQIHRQIAATLEFVDTKRGEVAASDAATIRNMNNHLSPVQLQVGAIKEAINGMAKAPYFHLGRFGDYFGSAKIRTNSDGTVNPENAAAVAEALEKAGFDDVQLSEANNRPKVVLRFETADQTNKFKAVMQELHEAGHLEGDLGEAVQAGARSREQNFGQTDGFPAFVQNYIQAIEASPIYTPDEGMTPSEVQALEKRKEEAVRLAVDTWLEAQPDTSISKVLAKRHTVPGYKKDMIRNYAHRARVGSISLANFASAPKFNEAFVDMRSAVEEAKRGDSTADQYLLNDLLAETKARDAVTPLDDFADNFDKARAIAHSYFLGMSPAYAFINMTQMGVVALPELAKKHGYGKSFHAMRRASGDAFKILKAAFNEAVKLGPENWANVAITETVLTNAGLSPRTAAFASRMIASGVIDIGSQARSLGQISENRQGSKLDTTLKYASALGMYSETFSRLVTALAADNLHGGKLDDAATYATDVVSQSMLDYQSWNTARALGKKGVLGPVTPIVTQFMSYSVQMTEKLLSEFMAAAGRSRPGESAEAFAQRKREARTFLAGHLTVIVAMTGTLGLPFMTVFATALERLIDQFDDDEQPFDITASYRGWLADVFGKDVAEVVSRGLPRAIGFDLSARAGEQNLAPFSEFIADRRPWREAIEANAARSFGAVPSMAMNILNGADKIGDGDVVAGLKEMLPVAFKGGLGAYQMGSDGYVDTNGNKLPMKPTTAAMVWQLLGVTPSEKAEYSEIRGDLASTKGEVTRRAGLIRDGVVKAMMQNDFQTANELMLEAAQFDADNPGVDLRMSIMPAYQRRVMGTMRANALQTPLGVSMNDIAGQQMSRYANVSYGN